ncbi:MAG TPA: SAM-dependent methyltransferase [Kofleriaceae bacterium]|nr:SAM-dependent methyltransferase [Kofleriaceae bacterium]
MATSRTAAYVALYRALETTEPQRQPLFEDRYARAFLPRSLDLALRVARVPALRNLLVRYADSRAPGARTSAIARTAYIDDTVRDAVGTGVRQLVLLGAGYDCRAHRMPELAKVDVFEVDRADTQQAKRARLRDSRDVHYVTVDFMRDDLAVALAAAGWRATEPTLVVWEGVTNYLTEPAVIAVLRWVGGTCAGSSIVFTYIHAGAIDGSVVFPGADKLVAAVRALGEPWTFGLHPDRVAEFVARASLHLRTNLGADDYRRRYLGDVDTGYAFYRIAVADVQA